MQDWRRESKGQMCIKPEKKTNVVAMSVVEDFIYLITSSSPSNLEVSNSHSIILERKKK